MLEVNKALVELNGTMAVQLINFLILLWLMNRLLVRPLGRVIEKREDRIDSLIQEADAHAGEVSEMLADYERQIAATTREANARQEERKHEVVERSEEDVAEAKQKAEEFMARAEEDLEKEVARVTDELRAQADELAKEVVQKIIGREPS